MKWKIAILFLMILFGIIIASSASNEDKISKEVHENIAKNNKVRVIVELKESSQKAKEDITNSVGKENTKHIFDKSVAVEISENELNELINNPNIESVVLDRHVKTFLQDSVLLINATTTWPVQISGINITGIDETICIIDTGVNSTHPDLQNKVVAEYCYCSINEGANANCCAGNLSETNDATDNNGHGTHVSGIVVANNTIKGVAIGAKIVAIKALNSSGDGISSDIKAAIDWCINNTNIQNYNISVVSMSLGGGSYTSYCNSDFLASSINSAVGKNVSVVVATGNSGSSSQISSPACVQNATSVASSTKTDGLSSFSNRNNITDLFAPGSSINSTRLNPGSLLTGCSSGGNNYMICSGTSMATPHVAGAFALVRQFFRLENGRVSTPYEIESALKDTGKIIYDSGSGLNFSRIDVYSAILSLDATSPNVTLISPSNNIISSNANQTFNCNATDEIGLANLTLEIWNSTSLYYENTTQSSENSLEIEFNVSMGEENYKWNCLAYDRNNNYAYANANYSITIENIAVSLISPLNNTITNQNRTFNCSATSLNNLSNVTLSIWNSSSILAYNKTNNISGTSNSSLFNYNFSYQDVYKWNCLFRNNINNYNSATSNFSIRYDITAPTLNITSPLNNSWNNSGKFNVSIDETGICIYSLNSGTDNLTMNSLNNISFGAVNSSLNGIQNVTFYCNDSAGNIKSSGGISFGIDLNKPAIDLISPTDSYSETSSSTSINFQFNFSDESNISECSLIINGVVNSTNSSITNQSQTHEFSQTFTPGTYNWSINCTDEIGNIGNSSVRSFTINSPATSSSSSGGGGNRYNIYNPTDEEMLSRYTKELEKNDKIKFNIEGESHLLTITDIKTNFVSIILQSYAINLLIEVGESAKINLSSSEYYDLQIKLNNIANQKANLTIQAIHEEIISSDYTPSALTKNETDTSKVEDNEEDIQEDEKINKDKKNIIITILIIAIIYILIKILMGKKQKIQKQRIDKTIKKLKNKSNKE